MQRHTIRFAAFPLFVALFAAAAGCSSSAAGDSVKGKVTLADKPVSGLVSFQGTDGKEASAPISPDGTYVMNNPPKGSVKVTIKSMGPAGGVRGSAPAKMKTDDMPSPPPPDLGVAPPARYAKPDNGLTFEVTGGPQIFDIPLTP